jgi:hypothetical protein
MATRWAERGRRERRIWVREILSPGEARAAHPRLWEVAGALIPGLDDDQLTRVVSLVLDTCPRCRRGDRGCGCDTGRRPGADDPAGTHHTRTVSDKPERAAIYLSLPRGEKSPAIDLQLDEALRDSRATGWVVAHVYGEVSGPLGGPRRRQLIRLLGRLVAGEQPAAIHFDSQDPSDRDFLGRQADLHGLNLSVGPRHVTVSTPWEPPTGDGRPRDPGAFGR